MSWHVSWAKLVLAGFRTAVDVWSHGFMRAFLPPCCSAVEVLPTGAPLLHLRCCSALAHRCPTCGMTRSWESSLQGGEHMGTEAAGGAGCLVLGVLEFGVWVNGQAKMRLLCNSQTRQVKNCPPLFKVTRVIWGGFYIPKGSSTPVEVGGKQWWHEQHHEDWGEMPRLELWGGHPGHVPLWRSPGTSCRQPASFPLKLNQQDWVGDKWFLYHGAMHRVISVKTFNPHTELLPVAPLAYRAVSLDRNQIYFSEVC